MLASLHKVSKYQFPTLGSGIYQQVKNSKNLKKFNFEPPSQPLKAVSIPKICTVDVTCSYRFIY